ncbi:MAG: hypothetical protein LBL34_02035 [Clostridiales bacterium]|jgi:hypothetical protein|nr:hypothetical protein [Clostridiales bacterium]
MHKTMENSGVSDRKRGSGAGEKTNEELIKPLKEMLDFVDSSIFKDVEANCSE